MNILYKRGSSGVRDAYVCTPEFIPSTPNTRVQHMYISAANLPTFFFPTFFQDEGL